MMIDDKLLKNTITSNIEAVGKFLGHICSTCIWWSTGLNDPQGAGYCYSEGDYTAENNNCACWQASLRDKPLGEPPMNEDGKS